MSPGRGNDGASIALYTLKEVSFCKQIKDIIMDPSNQDTMATEGT